MNILSGQVRETGSFLFVTDHFEMNLSLPSASSFGGGKRVHLGVRSENVVIGDDGPEGRIKLIEPLGDETLVFFSCGSEELIVAKVSAERVFRPGDPIRFCFNSPGVHFFDPESGVRLT